MARPLTPSEAAAALRRGKPVEQFVSLADGRLTFLTATPSRGRFNLSRHVVHDQGSEDFADITEAATVDEEEHIGEGVVVADFGDSDAAIAAADEHGGTRDGWVNVGVAASVHWEAKQRG